MDPDYHRQALVLVARRSDDVKVEAVLALLIANLITAVTNAFLFSVLALTQGSCIVSTYKGIVCRRKSTSPGKIQCLGVGETKLLNRRLCERDTKEEVLVVLAVVYTIV